MNSPLRRLRALSLILALSAVALIAAGCGDDKSSTASTSSADAKAALIAALKNATAIKTGEMQLDGKFGFSGGSAPSLGNITLAGKGPFDVSDPADPKLSLEIEVGVLGQTQKLTVTVIGKKTYLTVNGQAIELEGNDGNAVKQLTDGLGPGAIARISKQFETNVTNVKKVGVEKVGDGDVTVYAADIDFGKLIEAFSEDGKSGVFGQLSGTDAKQAKDAFKAKKVEFGVDESGKVVRLIRIEAEIVDPTGKDEGSGTFEITIKLLESDGPVEITAPPNAVKGDASSLGGLLGAFGGQ